MELDILRNELNLVNAELYAKNQALNDLRAENRRLNEYLDLAPLGSLGNRPIHHIVAERVTRNFHDLWIDTAIGFGLLAIYHGSATLAGVIVTVVLRFLRWFMGYKRYSFKRMQWEYHPY